MDYLSTFKNVENFKHLSFSSKEIIVPFQKLIKQYNNNNLTSKGILFYDDKIIYSL